MKKLIDGKLEYLNHNIVTAVISALVAMMALMIPDTLFGFIFNEDAKIFGGYDELFKYASVIIFVMVISTLMLRSFRAKNLGFEIKSVKSILVWSIGVALVFNVITLIAEKLDPSLASSSEQVIKSLRFGESSQRDVIAYLTVCVLAPIWEETVYRGICFRAIRDGLQKYIGSKWALFVSFALSSYLFMSAHSGGGQDAQQIYLFILAIMLALAYLYTGSLLAPILAHSFNNTFVLWTAFSKTGGNIAGMNYNVLVLAPIIAALVFLIVSAIYIPFSRGKTSI